MGISIGCDVAIARYAFSFVSDHRNCVPQAARLAAAALRKNDYSPAIERISSRIACEYLKFVF